MIAYSRQSINEDDEKAVLEALRSDFLTCGKRVEEFEQALCDFVGVKYAVVLNSATSALHVAYLCANLQKGDEFITTPLTFAATASAGLMTGAKPVFCDIKMDGNIDEEKIQSLITKNTKAIVPVDFGGLAVNMDKILQIAKKHKLLVINDASHALGSTYEDGSKVGSKADISIFSFHAIKPITTFEGGALLTNDEEIYKKAKKLRSHNIEKKSLWDSELNELGYNYRLSDVACALGLSQLKRLDNFLQTREKIALFYEVEFENNDFIGTIKIPTSLKSSRHLYPILLKEHLLNKKEDIFKDLLSHDIGVQVHYKPLFEYELFKSFYHDDLANASKFYQRELSLPCHQEMSLDMAKYVASKVLKILKKHS